LEGSGWSVVGLATGQTNNAPAASFKR